VIDLKKRFDIEYGEGTSAASRIIVAEIGDTQIGIIVEEVEDAMRVPRQSLSPPPRTLIAGMKTGYLTGICKLPDRMILLLDLDKAMMINGLNQICGNSAPIAAVKA
jgi:purine-binding chemotaxis protein CheW